MLIVEDLCAIIKMVVNFSFEANKYFNDQEPWKKKNKLIKSFYNRKCE